jgi:hypothetical protein
MQGSFAAPEALHQLLVCQVREAPLDPDQAIFPFRVWLPVLQAHIQDMPNAFGPFELVCEPGHGLHDINVLGNLQE